MDGPVQQGQAGSLMPPDEPIEQLLQRIAGLGREDCVAALRSIRRPRLDFTDQYFEQQSLEGLRHLLMAAVLQARRHRREAG